MPIADVRGTVAPVRPAGATATVKLRPPGAPAPLLPRPRVRARLDDGHRRRLTIVVAGAGFGKSTLLAAWLAEMTGGGRSAGWVSLDASENEPALFWAYCIRALQKTMPGVGVHALALLQSRQPPKTESVLTALINEVAAVDADFLLVLDDYHAIDAVEIHTEVQYLD